MPQAPVPQAVPFPFGPEFQMKLQKVLMLDDAGDLVMQQIQPSYFESPELRWIFAEMKAYFEQYHAMPTWMVLEQKALSADPKMRATIQQMLEYQKVLPVKEEQWIRSQIIEWVQQNIFHQAFKETKALWDNGKRVEARSHMQKQMDRMNEAVWRNVDRGWFFEELPNREAHRIQLSTSQNNIVTGIPDIDKILDGGLSPGELGIWIAYAKGGKSTMLMNHGAIAVRAQFKKVLHFVLEGSRSLIENRYEAWFASEYYSTVKKGGLSSDKYNQLWNEYQYLKTKLCIRGMVDSWAYTAIDLEHELKDLRKNWGWIPDLIIVDYGDLLKGRAGPYKAEWESQKDAFRDLKIIANRGFAVWTASQANYPDVKGYDTKEHEIKVNQIAGGKEKVRVADFVGSLNATVEEKAKGCARAYAELYRDNEAGKTIHLATDLAKMKIGAKVEVPGGGVGLGPGVPTSVPLGYNGQKSPGLGFHVKGNNPVV